MGIETPDHRKPKSHLYLQLVNIQVKLKAGREMIEYITKTIIAAVVLIVPLTPRNSELVNTVRNQTQELDTSVLWFGTSWWRTESHFSIYFIHILLFDTK